MIKNALNRLINRPFWLTRSAWCLVVVGLLCWFYSTNIQPSFDPMKFSGFLAVIVGLAYSIAVDRDHDALLEHWHVAGIIDLPPASRKALTQKTARESIVLQACGGLAILIIMYLGYEWIVAMPFPDEFFNASMICATLIGMRLGRLMAHGRLGRYLRTYRVPFWLTVGHPDRAGGLGRVGRFFLLQAFAVMAAILWLAIWSTLIAFGNDPGYDQWLSHFLVLLIVLIFIFCMAFLIPVISLRAKVLQWKRSNANPEISRLRSELADLRRSEWTHPRVRERDIVSELEEVILLPNWPIGPSTRSAFLTSVGIPLLVNITAAVFQGVL